MSSNPPSAIVASKASNAAKSSVSAGQPSPGQTQVGFTVFSGDGYGQRRGGGSGSYGAGASSRVSATQRNTQVARKQHKGSRRFNRFADDDVLADATNMKSTSRKGQTSITHLMNYSVSPSHHFGQRHFHRDSRPGRRNTTWGPGSGYHAADKARYVHANYRFVVDPRADCHVNSIDADIHLDWNNVLQILASSLSQEASCPICLGAPVAPRMAKCGHIFCLPCLFRYMHSEENSTPVPQKKARSRKCPICFDSVYLAETRPVLFHIGQEGEFPREGDDIVLRLVTRLSGSTLALPRDCADFLLQEHDIPWYFAAEVLDYARVMKGTEEYICRQFDNEIAALQVQEQEDELMFGEDNVEWTRRAVRAIQEAKEKVKGIGGPPAESVIRAEPKSSRPTIDLNPASDVPEMYHLQYASRSGQSSGSASSVPIPRSNVSQPVVSTLEPGSSVDSYVQAQNPTLKPANAARHSHHSSTPAEYFFYQALPHYYLSPLDIRILREAFGSFSSFPSTILPRVERVSTGHVIDDDLRKRTKYLAHLPHGCEVNFLECDWTDTVSPEVLERFKPEIDRRRKRNEEKEAREEKARLQAEKEEEKRYAYLRRRRPDSTLETERPFAPDDFQPLVAAEGADDAEAAGVDEISSSPPWSQRQRSGFASLASISTSPSASRTVWGTPAAIPTSPSQQAVILEQEVPDDGWLQGWERDLLQEDVDLVAQAEALSLAGESSKQAPAGGGGKKKKKKITLMSTTARRGA